MKCLDALRICDQKTRRWRALLDSMEFESYEVVPKLMAQQIIKRIKGNSFPLLYFSIQYKTKILRRWGMAKAKFERKKPHVNVGTIGHVDHGRN